MRASSRELRATSFELESCGADTAFRALPGISHPIFPVPGFPLVMGGSQNIHAVYGRFVAVDDGKWKAVKDQAGSVEMPGPALRGSGNTFEAIVNGRKKSNVRLSKTR